MTLIPNNIPGSLGTIKGGEFDGVVAFPGGEDRVYTAMCNRYLTWSDEEMAFVNNDGISEHEMTKEEITALCRQIDPNWNYDDAI